MDLIELKEFFESKKGGEMFNFGLSHPFSWRGVYAEVAFSITKGKTSREDILANINKAYSGTFTGYKGGEFSYDDHTPVNFEEDNSRWTDGGYCARLIAKIECGRLYESQEAKLIDIAFGTNQK